MREFKLLILLGILSLFLVNTAGADDNQTSITVAGGEELSVAIGHYARARSLLIAAVREFDAGRKHADPQVLIDIDAWRNSIIDRSEDLERVLAPQARATRDGVQFQSDTRLLDEAR